MELYKRVNRFLRYLEISQSELDTIINSIDLQFKSHKKQKVTKRGTLRPNNFRIINAPLEPLKKIQKKIQYMLDPNGNFSEHYFGGIRKKSNTKNALQHKGLKYHFLTDLVNCFPSISCRRVYNSLVEIGYSADVSRIITRLTTLDGHIPQGTPTSMILCNLALKPMVTELADFSEKNNLKFTIYVDDLTFSSSSDFRYKTQEILRIMISNGLKISREKTHYRTNRATITGIRVTQNYIYPASYTVAKLSLSRTLDKRRGLENYVKGIVKANNKQA